MSETPKQQPDAPELPTAEPDKLLPVTDELQSLEAEAPTGAGTIADVTTPANAPSPVVANTLLPPLPVVAEKAPATEPSKPTAPSEATLPENGTAIIASGGKKKRKKRTLVLAALGGILVLAGAATTVLMLRGNASERASTTDSVKTTKAAAKLGVAVTVVDGTVLYQHGEFDMMALTPDVTLIEGDIVRTNEGSRAVLTFDDGSALRLDANTTVTLVSLAADDIKITQNEGIAYSRVVPSERSYTVIVGATEYKALGTAFSTTNTATEKGVQVFQSSVKAGKVATAVKEGEQYFHASSDASLKEKITAINLDAVVDNTFLQWNQAEDEKDDTFKEKMGVFVQVKALKEQKAKTAEAQKAKEAATPAQPAGIALAGAAGASGAELTWTVNGVTVPDGFKVVRSSSSSTPTFGKDDATYVSDGAARSYTWKSTKAGSYWFRVCAYQAKDSTCNNYSNAIKLDLAGTTESEKMPVEKVTRGHMTLSINQVGKATWSYTGKALYGYKLVASKSPSPVYPDNSVAYFDANATSGYLSVNAPGTYYVRLCAWTNGTESTVCLDYSNQVTYTKN